MQRQPVVPLFLYVCACVSVTWARHILNFISAFLAAKINNVQSSMLCLLQIGMWQIYVGLSGCLWACGSNSWWISILQKKKRMHQQKQNRSLCSFHQTWGLKNAAFNSHFRWTVWMKKETRRRSEIQPKGATGDACRVKLTEKNKKPTTVCCFLPLRQTHTCKLFNSANTQTLYTPPRSILVGVYSWPDQITCDTGMKSGQAQSFSLHTSSLFIWVSLTSHDSHEIQTCSRLLQRLAV